MRRSLTILALFVCYFLLTAKSCSNQEEFKAEQEQKQASKARDSIRKAASADSLSPETLKVFEESAKMKVIDLLGYQKIAADSSLDPTYRQQARKMIRGFTFSESNLNTIILDSTDVILVSQPLYKTNDSTYFGKLSCRGQTIDFHVTRRATIIGSDTIKAWKTFFGSITALNPTRN